MNTVLVTGATSFLGYHVVKRLNEMRIRPRVLELPGVAIDVLARLDIERCPGHLGEPEAMTAACRGAHTLLHTAFKVSVGGGTHLLNEMRRVNVDGSRRLLQAAASVGVRRAVVTGSALAIGVNRRPAELDESAEWARHAFALPYARIRREAELDALAQSTPHFDVMTVCPAFTFGPDDPIGAPANKLLQALISQKLKFTLPVGFACTDVRDFAQGMVLAAEGGRARQRYLLTGGNVTTSELLQRAATIAGVRAPRFTPPLVLVKGLVRMLEAVSAIRRKPAPVTSDVLEIIGRYAWYDSTKARTELGWKPRPLEQTLADTIGWLRSTPQRPAAAGTMGVNAEPL
jgi:dihydroflavonol-4-reductase